MLEVIFSLIYRTAKFLSSPPSRLGPPVALLASPNPAPTQRRPGPGPPPTRLSSTQRRPSPGQSQSRNPGFWISDPPRPSDPPVAQPSAAPVPGLPEPAKRQVFRLFLGIPRLIPHKKGDSQTISTQSHTNVEIPTLKITQSEKTHGKNGLRNFCSAHPA